MRLDYKEDNREFSIFCLVAATVYNLAFSIRNLFRDRIFLGRMCYFNFPSKFTVLNRALVTSFIKKQYPSNSKIIKVTIRLAFMV